MNQGDAVSTKVGEGKPDSGPPGYAWVKDGVFGWCPPEDGQKGPVIIIGQHVTVSVNGKSETKRCTLQAEDVVEVVAEQIEPISDVTVEVSGDGLRASVTTQVEAGKRYRLIDAPPGRVLNLRGEFAEDWSAAPVTEQRIYAAIQAAGVTYGVDSAAVQVAAANPSGKTEIARGSEPVESVDGRIEYCFKEVEMTEHDPEALKVDLFDRQHITWVSEQTLLARRHPPVPGQTGVSVTGSPIVPKAPRDVQLKGGSGTVLSEDKDELYAAAAGRPVVAGRVVRVLPLFVHQADADALSGHIRFVGDIQITGQITEGIEVSAGGGLEVFGLVHGANVKAQLDTRLHNNAIASEVSVGGETAAAAQVLPFISDMVNHLQRLLRAIEQIEGSGMIQTYREKGLPYGLVIKQLIEKRFGDLLKRLPEINGKLAALSEIVTVPPETEERLQQILPGARPLSLESAEPIRAACALWQGLEEELNEIFRSAHSLTVKGVQNCHVAVSGSMYVTGFGCYNSTIRTGQGVEASGGVLRGGQLYAREGTVKFKEIGSQAGVPTVLLCGKGAVVESRIIHPGVIVSVGGIRRVVEETGKNFRASLDASGELEIEVEPIR